MAMHKLSYPPIEQQRLYRKRHSNQIYTEEGWEQVLKMHQGDDEVSFYLFLERYEYSSNGGSTWHPLTRNPR